MLLTYFKNINYTTWWYFNYTRSPHTLDNFIFSQPFFRWVKYFKVVNIGMRSNHTFILPTFKITAIKSKVNEKVVAQTNWKIIWYHKLINEIFNNSISMSISGSTAYSNYNKHILESGTHTATINIQKSKWWFHLIRDSLLPLIKARYSLLSDYQNLGIVKGDSSESKLRLSVFQLSVYNVIALAK